jgi:hypothetical protein
VTFVTTLQQQGAAGEHLGKGLLDRHFWDFQQLDRGHRSALSKGFEQSRDRRSQFENAVDAQQKVVRRTFSGKTKAQRIATPLLFTGDSYHKVVVRL